MSTVTTTTTITTHTTEYNYNETEVMKFSNKQYPIISNQFIVYIKVFELIFDGSDSLRNEEYIYYKIELYFHYQQEQEASFYDKLIFKHSSRDLIHDTIMALFTTFECENFIEYNANYNQFKFCFIHGHLVVLLEQYFF